MKEKNMKKWYRSAGEILEDHVVMEVPQGESETIPDQAMGTREILHRFTSGQTLDINAHTPVYLENVPLYDTRRKHNIDLAVDRLENQEIIQEISADVYDKKTSLESIQNQKRQQKIERPVNQDVTVKASE